MSAEVAAYLRGVRDGRAAQAVDPGWHPRDTRPAEGWAVAFDGCVDVAAAYTAGLWDVYGGRRP